MTRNMTPIPVHVTMLRSQGMPVSQREAVKSRRCCMLTRIAQRDHVLVAGWMLQRDWTWSAPGNVQHQQKIISVKQNKNSVHAMQGSTRRFQTFLDKKMCVTPMLEMAREWILDMKKKQMARSTSLALWQQISVRWANISRWVATKLISFMMLSSDGTSEMGLETTWEGKLSKQGGIAGNYWWREIVGKQGLRVTRSWDSIAHCLVFDNTIVGFNGCPRHANYGGGFKSWVKILLNGMKNRHRYTHKGVSLVFAPKLLKFYKFPDRFFSEYFPTYLSKRPQNMMHDSNPFYLAISHNRPTRDSTCLKNHEWVKMESDRLCHA